MGLFDSLFKGKSETTTLEPMLTDEQKRAQTLLTNYGATGKLNDFQAGEAYGGALGSYDLTPNEQMLQSGVMDLINRGSVGGNAGRSALLDMVNNQFNPDDPSSGYGAYSRQANRAFQGGLDALNRESAITGNRFSTAIIGDKADLAAQQSDILASKLAELYNQGENRKFGAAQGLLQEEQRELEKFQTAQQFAQLERQLKDAEAQAKYSDFLRQRNERLSSVTGLNSVFNRGIEFGSKELTTTRPSTLAAMFGEINPLMGSYNTHQFGYDTNQSSLSDLVSMFTKASGGGIPGSGGGGGGGGYTFSGIGSSSSFPQAPYIR